MAEKKTMPTFEALMKDLKGGNFAPVYILMGDESYFIDVLTDYLTEHLVEPESRDFNLNVIFGADVTAEQIASMAREYPMMSNRRAVIVKEAQSLKSMDALEKYFENPAQTTTLVMCFKNGSVDRRKKWVAKAEAVGVLFESKKKREYELPGFISGYLHKHKMEIDAKAAAMVAEHIGADLNRIVSELDKVLIAVQNTTTMITPDIIEQQVGINKDFNSFELRKAIVNRDVFKANQIVKYFDKNPKAGSLYSILPLLFAYFQNLMIAYYAPNRSNADQVAKFLGLRSGWAAEEYMLGMKNYKAVKTMQILTKMREIDAKSKGINNPNTPENQLMQELIFFILH